MPTTAALVKGHWLNTWGNAKFARCECSAVFSWENHEEKHAAHILAVIYEQGHEEGEKFGVAEEKHLASAEGYDEGGVHECKDCPVWVNPYSGEDGRQGRVNWTPRAPVGRWWYPARLNEEGQVEVYYPKKNPVWQVQKEAQENLNKRTRRRQSEPGTEAGGN